LTLGGDVTATAAPSVAGISGLLDLGGATRVVDVADGSAAVDLLIGAQISNGGLTKRGAGTLRLTANNTFSGPTTIEGGTLLVDGVLASAINVGPGSTLAGSGSGGPVTVSSGGTLSPGSSPGVFSTGNLTLQPGALFVVELNGYGAGTGYDQVAMTGSVDLNGAVLDLRLGFVPTNGTQFIIINNDGTDAVGGWFAGLTEHAEFTQSGTQLQISYLGGDGNDVMLTVIPEPSAWQLACAGLLMAAVFARKRR
jgi:autotransporter-associated beta strand protein